MAEKISFQPITDKERQELEELVNLLGNIRGSHTELVTVLIPSGTNIHQVSNQLAAEAGTAENIKSKATRTAVVSALETIIRELKNYKQTPQNGLAIFCGNVSEKEGVVDIKIWAYEPPRPLNVRLYRCDKTFVIAPLKEILDVSEVYGLLVMDRREATIGLLEGKQIKLLRTLTSGVPGKIRAGGQCLSPETLIMKDNGELIEIKDSHNPLIIISENFNTEKTELTPLIAKWENKKQIFKVITKYPRFEIKASAEHTFFVRTDNGIEEKPLNEIREGDFLLIPEKITIIGAKQKIDSIKYYNSFVLNEAGKNLLKLKRKEVGLLQRELAKKIETHQTSISYFEIGKQDMRRDVLFKICKHLNLDFNIFLKDYTTPKKYGDINLPTELKEDFARLLGYYLGDGSIEEDRITYFEQNLDVALYYMDLIKKLFGFYPQHKFRESKNYHQIRITRRPLVRLIKSEFPELKKAIDSEIPKKILISEDNILASFIAGLFDAEGYVTDRVALGINNEKVIRQLQLSLLRFGIISSLNTYNNKMNPYSKRTRFTLAIDDKKSLEIFKDKIGFISKYKKQKLDILLRNRSNKSNVRQIAINGKEIARILRNSGISTTQFMCPDFFVNKKQLSKEIFKKNILDKISNIELKRRLELFYLSNLIIVKISKIEPLGFQRTIDIETKNHNFIANGLVVHNSAQRFERLTEGFAKEFFRRVAEAMKEIFFDMPKLKGILIGGPVPTKEEFLEQGELVTKLKEKVIAIKDLGYTDEHGLKLLVEASEEDLAEQELVKEKAIINRFFETLGKNKEKAAYGLEKTLFALEKGAVDSLLISKKLPKEQTIDLEIKAENIGASVFLISTENQEGRQFFNLTKGVGAILRFQIE